MTINMAIDSKYIAEITALDYHFIDTRNETDYKRNHLSSFINIPYNDDFYNNHFDKSKPIILICYSGELTAKISFTLRKKGYQSYYIYGGMAAVMMKENNYY